MSGHKEWAQVAAWPMYMVSIHGEVRKQGKLLKGSINALGYVAVGVTNGNGVWKTVYVHRLMAEAFLPNPDNKPDVNHKDSVRHNNYLSNLEWATRQENLDHAAAKGRMKWFGKTVSDADMAGIVQRHADGERYMDIATELGISADALAHRVLRYKNAKERFTVANEQA